MTKALRIRVFSIGSVPKSEYTEACDMLHDALEPFLRKYPNAEVESKMMPVSKFLKMRRLKP